MGSIYWGRGEFEKNWWVLVDEVSRIVGTGE